MSRPELVLTALAALAALPWVAPARADVVARGGNPAGSDGPGQGHDRVRPEIGPVSIDPAVLVDLADSALAAGASIPAALTALGEAVGQAVGGEDARVLRRTGSALLLGASWTQAWSGASPALRPLERALEPAWVDGVATGPLLRGAADRIRADRSREAQEAAARLGVRLVLPLGLCFLPAFVLLGLIPVLLSAGVGLFG